MDERAAIAEALRLLGKDNLVLAIHDASFPESQAFDLGRGSPYSEGAGRLFELAARLGFTGIQFGPQGLQEEGSASPYEATLFSRNPLNVDLRALASQGLIDAAEVETALVARPSRTSTHSDHRFAFATAQALLAAAAGRMPRSRELAQFLAENDGWLLRDGLYDVLVREHGGWWREWSGAHATIDRRLFSPAPGDEPAARERISSLRSACADALDRYAITQFLLAEQHRAMRARLGRLGLRSYADLQVGLSARDEWAHQHLALAGYRMGAPPSRTNPEGQPWNYPVLDPAQYRDGDSEGPALAFVRARVRKLFAEHDGLRIDHPHGLVCPWVYRADALDPLRAVQTGARLFSSPELADHPELARLAIARVDQIDPAQPRYADRRIRSLDSDQVDRYAVLIDAIVEEQRAAGRRHEDLVCEVLSTLPYPLERVLARHRLGRFRVTQKADLANPADVYRSENARPEDWIMLGNHDTPPIWRVLERWRASGRTPDQARYLAVKLAPDPAAREAMARALAADEGRLAQALLADVLASPARNVQIFVADLVGLTGTFNVPGTVGPENWCLRVPADFETAYPGLRAKQRALNLPAACALALRSRGEAFASAHGSLLGRLDRLASGDLPVG